MEDQLNGNHPDMALASFMIELEILGHIHDQHRDLDHVSRGLTLLRRRGKTERTVAEIR